MSITITITDPTPAQIAALFDLEETASNARAAEGAKTAVPKSAAKKTEDAPETASTTKTDASPSDAAVPDLDAVKAAAQKFVTINDRDALAEIVTEFGGKNLSSIPEDKRAAFIARLEQ